MPFGIRVVCINQCREEHPDEKLSRQGISPAGYEFRQV